MSITFRAGWIPTPASRPRVRFTGALREGTAPPSADYSRIPSIGMHLNDQWGCCTCSGNANVVEQQTYYGQGSEVVVPDAAVLVAYEKVGNFNPNAGSPGNNPTDNGAMISDALKYLQSPGMAGHTIALYGDIDVSQVEKIKTAISEFGFVDVGVNLPNSAMGQFDTGTWDYDPTADNTIAGGHCVILCGYNSAGFLVFTWDKVILMTWAWWAHFGGEAWTGVSHDWVSAATAKDPEGVDLDVLGQEVLAILGTNPFAPPPGPTPEPIPIPAPTPGPAPTSWWCRVWHNLLGK